MARKIRMSIDARIDSNATVFLGAGGIDRTYWSASVSILGHRFAHVGMNGEGRYKTAASAERAAIKKARRILAESDT